MGAWLNRTASHRSSVANNADSALSASLGENGIGASFFVASINSANFVSASCLSIFLPLCPEGFPAPKQIFGIKPPLGLVKRCRARVKETEKFSQKKPPVPAAQRNGQQFHPALTGGFSFSIVTAEKSG
jgi:hypothetical protein